MSMELVETGLLTDEKGNITGEVEIYDDGTFKIISPAPIIKTNP